MSDRARLIGVAVMCLAFVAAPGLQAQRNCTRGKPCGNTCINVNYTCRAGGGSAAQSGQGGQNSSGNGQGTARGLISSPRPSPAAPPAPIASLGGAASYCSTGLDSARELLVVAGSRPSAVIGRNLGDGSAFTAPNARDTIAVDLVAIRCPTTTTAELYVKTNGSTVALDYRSVRLRWPGGDSEYGGNIRLRSAGGAIEGFVWLDPLGVATLRGDQR